MMANYFYKKQFLLLLLFQALTVTAIDANDRESRPHVVVMLADNLGYGDLGVYGSGGQIRGMPTPNIDALASESLVLTQFFVEPGCTPSRAACRGCGCPRAGLSSFSVLKAMTATRAGDAWGGVSADVCAVVLLAGHPARPCSANCRRARWRKAVGSTSLVHFGALWCGCFRRPLTVEHPP